MKPCRWPRDAILSVTISSVVLAQPSIMESDPRPFGEVTALSKVAPVGAEFLGPIPADP